MYKETFNELENSEEKSEKEWKVMDKISLNLVEADRHFEKNDETRKQPWPSFNSRGKGKEGGGEVLKDS